MKSSTPIIIVILIALLTSPILAQEVIDFNYFIAPTTDTKLKFNGQVKSIKEYNCPLVNGVPSDNKTCPPTKIYALDPTLRLIKIVRPHIDSISYMYQDKNVEEVSVELKSNTQLYKTVYEINTKGWVTKRTTTNTDGVKRAINKLDKKQNLLEHTEYDRNNRKIATIKIEYDKDNNPIMINTLNANGQIFTQLLNTYSNNKITKSATTQQTLSGLGNFEHRFAYDAHGNMITKEQYSSEGAFLNRTKIKYDDYGNKIEVLYTYKNRAGEYIEEMSEYEYVYDEYKNWIQITLKSDNKVTVTSRVIEYWK